jgi:pimeloyl-ACP methyl ester carboxylesterase
LVDIGSGRRLSVAGFGDPRGTPVLFLHGWPGSRLQAGVLEASALRHGAWILAPDRPGLGRSDPAPGRTISGFCADVRAVLDRFGIPRISVIGLSGGAPYAAACAATIPERIGRVALVSGSGPIARYDISKAISTRDGVLYYLELRLSLVLTQTMSKTWKAFAVAPEKSLENWARFTPTPDSILLNRPDFQKAYIRDYFEAFSQGVAGQVTEGLLLAQPWDFELSDVRKEVHVFHGEADVSVPLEIAQYVHEQIADSTLHVFANEGHISLITERADTILTTLLTGSAAH